MKTTLLTRLILILSLIVLSGCSSMTLETAAKLDLTTVDSIQLIVPEQDRWELSKTIASELQSSGFTLAGSAAAADLLLEYATVDGPDIDAEGVVSRKLQSLHLHFKQPQTQALQASLDYYYPQDGHIAPQTGVEEMFTAIRQHLQQKSETKPLVADTPPAAPVTAEPLSKQTQAASATAADSLTVDNRTEEKRAATEPESETPLKVKKNSAEQLERKQLPRSPWLPRMKSWGFENWGEQEISDY